MTDLGAEKSMEFREFCPAKRTIPVIVLKELGHAAPLAKALVEDRSEAPGPAGDGNRHRVAAIRRSGPAGAGRPQPRDAWLTGLAARPLTA